MTPFETLRNDLATEAIANPIIFPFVATVLVLAFLLEITLSLIAKEKQ